MGTIIIDRVLPAPEALDALDAALTAALGAKYLGAVCGSGGIVLHLDASATAEDENTARMIALSHDFASRTPGQLELAAIGVDGADVITRYLATEIAGKTPDQIYTLMQTAIDGITSLADAKAFLRKWLPLMAAIDQLNVRKEIRGL